MPRRYSPREFIKVIESLGWRWVRTVGSHARYEQPGGLYPVTVDLHYREFHPRLLKLMLNQAGLPKNVFEQQAERVL